MRTTLVTVGFILLSPLWIVASLIFCGFEYILYKLGVISNPFRVNTSEYDFDEYGDVIDTNGNYVPFDGEKIIGTTLDYEKTT